MKLVHFVVAVVGVVVVAANEQPLPAITASEVGGQTGSEFSPNTAFKLKPTPQNSPVWCRCDVNPGT